MSKFRIHVADDEDYTMILEKEDGGVDDAIAYARERVKDEDYNLTITIYLNGNPIYEEKHTDGEIEEDTDQRMAMFRLQNAMNNIKTFMIEKEK